MSHIDVKIKIERVDEENGCIEVSFINPYGDIETGKKTLEDFRHIYEEGWNQILEDEWYFDGGEDGSGSYH